MIIGPTTRLSVTVIRPTNLVMAGEKFEVSITISPDPMNSLNEIQILEFFIEYLEDYLLPPDTFTVAFGHGNTEEFGE